MKHTRYDGTVYYKCSITAHAVFYFPFLQKLFQGNDGELSVIGRLAAGACAGMTSTFVSWKRNEWIGYLSLYEYMSLNIT